MAESEQDTGDVSSGSRRSRDPYLIDDSDTTPPPSTIGATLVRLGPGLIVSGSIVGSGELIATTALGAAVGYTALWLIVVSCLIKVIIQAELGRFTISSGESTLRAFARVPGPKLRVSWALWAWIVMILVWLIQIGGIIGGVGQALTLMLPALSDRAWVFVVSAFTGLYLLRGSYRPVELASTIMVVAFTFTTVICAIALEWTPYKFQLDDFARGFRFQIPQDGLAVAVAMFGITGVGATELIQYPYWCIEKGYARFAGRRTAASEWAERARGWIRVMHIDVLVSMVIYTAATMAFFVLGASVLHRSGTAVPPGFGLVKALSLMYTESLGGWAYWLFVVGAFFVLYSTYFVSIAAHSRLISDAIGVFGVWDLKDYESRMRWTRRLIVVLSVISPVMYYFVASPLGMVIIGGIMQAVMLPVIGAITIYLRYTGVDERIQPSRSSDIILWICVALIFLLAAASLA